MGLCEAKKAFVERRLDDALTLVAMVISILASKHISLNDLRECFIAFRGSFESESPSQDEQIALLAMEADIQEWEQAEALHDQILAEQAKADSAAINSTGAAAAPVTFSKPKSELEIIANLATLREQMGTLVSDFKAWVLRNFAGKPTRDNDVERLSVNGENVRVANVRGDGKCGPRAIFTWIALDELGILLPGFFVPELDTSPELRKRDNQFIGFIDRLKELMIGTLKILATHPDFATLVVLIKANARISHDQYRQEISPDPTDEDHTFWDVYRKILMAPGYQFTIGEIPIVATLLSRPIRVHMFRMMKFTNTLENEPILPNHTHLSPIVIMNNNNAHFRTVMPS